MKGVVDDAMAIGRLGRGDAVAIGAEEWPWITNRGFWIEVSQRCVPGSNVGVDV